MPRVLEHEFAMGGWGLFSNAWFPFALGEKGKGFLYKGSEDPLGEAAEAK